MSRCRCAYPCGCYQFKKQYGFFSFCFDLFMITITCGVWLIWIFVREMRG